MSDWKEKRFGDLLTEPVRNGVYKPKEFHGSGVNVVNMGELFAHPRLRSVAMNRLQLSEKEKEKALLQNGDLIFARRSLTAEGAGKCSLVYDLTEETTFESSIIRARPDESKASSSFLYYYFNSPYGKYLLGTILRQVAVAGITGSDLVELEMRIPTVDEQGAIAEVLSSLDDKIDLLHHQNKTLESLAQTLFRQWFIEEAGPSWKEGTLADLSDNIRENVQPSDISPDATYVGLEHIERKHFALYSTGTAEGLGSNKSVFKRHDILFGKLRPYFHKVCFAPVDGVCSTDILVIRPKDELYFPFCLLAYFQKDVVDHSDMASEGTRMPRTNWHILGSYPLRMPDAATLEKFNAAVAPSILKIEKNLKQIASLIAMRGAALLGFMSGDLVLT